MTYSIVGWAVAANNCGRGNNGGLPKAGNSSSWAHHIVAHPDTSVFDLGPNTEEWINAQLCTGVPRAAWPRKLIETQSVRPWLPPF